MFLQYEGNEDVVECTCELGEEVHDSLAYDI